MLFALTGFTTLVVEGVFLERPIWSLWVVLMIAVCGGAANAFNQYLERDLDAKMQRTKTRRPLPQGKVSPEGARIFAILLTILTGIFFALFTDPIAFLFALGTIVFYSWFYTIWLKPRTPYNIVIGGAAGGAAPLIASAAATGSVSAIAWILFLIVFLWTPPHFWALALHCKKDYADVGIPMLPLIHGDEATRRQIFGYCLVLVPLTLIFYPLKMAGWIYLSVALCSGAYLLYQAGQLFLRKNNEKAFRLFGYSIGYLFLLFVGLIVDRLI